MGKTITTHNGSAAHREHNIRNPKATENQEHINKALKGQNEILHDEPPREAYRRLFGAAQAAYNQKMREQGRPGRQIQSYYGHVEKDAKKHPVYEMIVQIGDREDTGIDAPVERECLKEFYAGWKERNPSLECIGAYIHADEDDGTLHMHVDYIPVATGYKKGMEVQNGLTKALEQQGFSMQKGGRTAQIQWEARENAVLESICLSHGIEVVHPEGEKKQHLDTRTYKAEQKLKALERDIEKFGQAADREEQRLFKATGSREILAMELKSLEGEKDALEGYLEFLQGNRDELITQNEELSRGATEMERELPALAAQISEAKAEVEELTRARDILTGAVENEINQMRFHVPGRGSNSPDYQEKWRKLDKGELLALYNDGSIRTVTRNPKGGMDYKTIDDEAAGLCRVGWFKTEETVRVPRNLLMELIAVRDRTQPLSQNLANLIRQQETVSRVVDKVKKKVPQR